MPTKARYSVSLKTLLAGLGVALLSACSGGPTSPSAAPKVEGRSSGLAPVGRSNTGYVVAEKDSLNGGAGLTNLAGTLSRKLPVSDVPPIDQ
jgi:hypothetical protein